MTVKSDVQCYVCAKHPAQSEEIERSNAIVYRVTCPRCGVYDVAYKFIVGEKGRSNYLTEDERLRLSHAIRRATDAHGRFGEFGVLGYESLKQIAAQHPLPDPVEQGDLLIESISKGSSYGIYTPEEHTEAWAARIGLQGPMLLKALQSELSALVRHSGLDEAKSPKPQPSTKVRFVLTLEGWKRAREIRKERGPGNQAFVAMWFHPGLLSAYTDGFSPALVDTGHQPYRVDLAAHNNKIDDQIVAEIRRSKLLVVDATGARPNAYWEAGFAAGLGIPVIWCCNGSWEACIADAVPNSSTVPPHRVRSWMEVLALDTRQHSFVVWSDPADLKEKLTARIQALGFDATWNRGQR